MLNAADDEAKELSLLCQGRFTGDPSHEFEVTKYTIVNENTEDENVDENKVMNFSIIFFIIDSFPPFFSHNYVKKND